MTAVAIDHTLGKVIVKRDKKEHKVEVKFDPDKKPFPLKNGDTVITGKDGYVSQICQYKDGKYNSQIFLGPDSKLSLEISTVISKINLQQGLFRLSTNAPLEIPFVKVKYIFDEFPQAQSTGKTEIFGLIKVEKDKIIFGNKSFPVDLIHKKTSEKIRLMANEQIIATPEKIEKEEKISPEVKKILTKTMKINQDKIDKMVAEHQTKLEKEFGPPEEKKKKKPIEKSKPKQKPTELDKKLEKLNKEVEQGLEKLSKEIE
jgi:hypothetical protein